MAKCYFAKHKLVWEVLEGGLKSKIEIQWSDITALKVTLPEVGDGSLDVMVSLSRRCICLSFFFLLFSYYFSNSFSEESPFFLCLHSWPDHLSFSKRRILNRESIHCGRLLQISLVAKQV